MATNYFVDSFSHDYAMFMPKEQRKYDNVIEIDRKNQDRQKTAHRTKARSVSASKLVTVSLAAVALLLLIVGIFLRVQITEVTSQINAMQTKIERSQAANTELEMQLEAAVSIDNLEQKAQSLGMHKAENYQMNYIAVYDHDNITDGEE